LSSPATGASSLYLVDVLTGAATRIGDFPSFAPIIEVAVALDTP
jgi:hypothetical protein